MTFADAWDQADSAEPRPYAYFGQLYTSAEAVAFEPTGETKPDGKPKMVLVPFDPSVHKDDQRRIQVALELVPLAELHLSNTVIQKTLDTDGRWTRFTLPSLKALNTTGRGINQQWVRMERRVTGRKFAYQGQDRDETALVVTAIYPTEEACIGAWSAEFGKNGSTHDAAPAAAPAGNAERETAKRFLPALWKQAGGDLMKFADILAKTAPVAKYFTIDSPEVVALVGGAA